MALCITSPVVNISRYFPKQVQNLYRYDAAYVLNNHTTLHIDHFFLLLFMIFIFYFQSLLTSTAVTLKLFQGHCFFCIYIYI